MILLYIVSGICVALCWLTYDQVLCGLDAASCASVAEQLKAAGSAGQTPSSAADAGSVLSSSHQSQASSTGQAQTQSSSRHAGLSEAAFKRVVGETPPSADELEKVQQQPL